MTADVRITRRATFAAGHILCSEDWTDEKNREVFGACSTDHGHNYVIEVTVGGVVDQETGMVVNLKHVDNVLRRETRRWRARWGRRRSGTGAPGSSGARCATFPPRSSACWTASTARARPTSRCAPRRACRSAP